jgi:hypothetical protein
VVGGCTGSNAVLSKLQCKPLIPANFSKICLICYNDSLLIIVSTVLSLAKDSFFWVSLFTSTL